MSCEEIERRGLEDELTCIFDTDLVDWVNNPGRNPYQTEDRLMEYFDQEYQLVDISDFKAIDSWFDEFDKNWTKDKVPITVYVEIDLDPVSLLKGEKPDIEEAVKETMTQTDYYDYKICEELYDISHEYGEAFEDVSSEDMLSYISVDAEDVAFNPEETNAVHGLIAFDVAVTFDTARFVEEVNEKIQEQEQEEEEER